MNTIVNLSSLVDSLADIRAQIADLQEQEQNLRDLLIASGQSSIDGVYHTLKITEQSGRVVTDWKTIAQKFEPSRQLVSAHTTQGKPFHVLRLLGRTGQ